MNAEALRLIDEFLADTKNQSLIDAGRVRDFLLDLRLVARGYDLDELERDNPYN